MAQIFISYRRDDSAYIAGDINQKLVEAFGANSTFLDIDAIPIGVDFRTYIDEAIAACDTL